MSPDSPVLSGIPVLGPLLFPSTCIDDVSTIALSVGRALNPMQMTCYQTSRLNQRKTHIQSDIVVAEWTATIARTNALFVATFRFGNTYLVMRFSHILLM